MSGIDDYTVETVGHPTKKMLERYAHPSSARKLAALDTVDHTQFVHALVTHAASHDELLPH